MVRPLDTSCTHHGGETLAGPASQEKLNHLRVPFLGRHVQRREPSLKTGKHYVKFSIEILLIPHGLLWVNPV